MAPRPKWSEEKITLLKKMVEQEESTTKIARLVDMSVRAVQKFIQDHESEELGGQWRPFVRRKDGRIGKGEA